MDESATINASLVQYFKQENFTVFDLSDNSLYMQTALSVLMQSSRKTISYGRQMGRVISDSFLWHIGIKDLVTQQYNLVMILRDSRLPPFAVGQVLAALKRRNIRLHRLDLSKSFVLQETVIELVRYLLCEASFELTEIILDHTHIGDQHMNMLSEALVSRYNLFWDTQKPPEVISVTKTVTSRQLKHLVDNKVLMGRRRNLQQKPDKQQLEMFKIFSICNVGITDIGLQGFLMSLEKIIQQVVSSICENSEEQDPQQKWQKISFYDVASKLINQNNRVTRSTLMMINELSRIQNIFCSREDVIKIIKLDLNIALNDGSDRTIQTLAKTINKYDCFRSINISGLKHVTGNGLVSFTAEIQDSLNLEHLEIQRIQLRPQQFEQTLENICENFSIKSIRINIPVEVEDLQNLIRKNKVLMIWNKTLYFSE